MPRLAQQHIANAVAAAASRVWNTLFITPMSLNTLNELTTKPPGAPKVCTSSPGPLLSPMDSDLLVKISFSKFAKFADKFLFNKKTKMSSQEK